ncbi:hypothetical protein SERLADRAFT_438981 [Serpula lacrymans var. lacrymans S7.9]|uniref:Uncharacterized protein n=1 Tax=Serpula lacrymans var. lacrymans (strain S7.9) TaxID=578457 RepID=F8NYJ8_SERL9|nr:uncharacterized protein SERLADRAFT_438981 [Serpula lacrymans var. lacrymans S7.9]EGO23669.1 hypothetical protein SERLADRAFT_438981 [Serpula lacrymans var. lacrymans S7.9]
MVVITRSQGHKIVEQMALRRAVQSVIFVIHADFLDSFLDAALYNNNLATSVQSLHIIFHRTFPPIPKLCRCLLAIRNVVDLELQLPRASAANWVETIEDTIITTSKYPFVLLSEIEGPSLRNVSDFALPLICLLSSSSTSTTALTVLQLDFDPTDYDLLRRIANAAPFVTTLKLVERSRSVSARMPRLRRAWNFYHQWAQDLAQLKRLHRFALKTSLSMVQNPGSDEDERKLLTQWRLDHYSTHDWIYAWDQPSVLRHLTLWYLAESKAGILSSWDMVDGCWLKTRGYLDPPADAFC